MNRRSLLLASLATVLVLASTFLAACNAWASPRAAIAPPRASPSAGADVTAAAAAFDPQTLDLRLERVVTGLDQPVHVTSAHDGSGRLFVVERRGRILIVRNGALVPQPFLDIRANVGAAGSEQGLLSVAFHPRFPDNRFLYVNYTDRNGDTVIARYTVSGNPDVVDAGSAETLLFIEQPAANHNGGLLIFGPDGYLYAGMGDGGGAGDQFRNAQNLSSLLGKILRIDVDAAFPYAIPPDNPFVGVQSTRPEIWAFGLRNPWRFSFDRATNDLYIADVGQNRYEWVHFHAAGTPGGENFGWPILEGSHCFPESVACNRTGLPMPIAEYSHDFGCSITGGHVYRGTVYPHVAGVYFFGDFCSGRIWSLDRLPNGAWRQTQVADTNLMISSFGEDQNGEQFLTSLEAGELYRLVFASTAAQIPTRTSTPPIASAPTSTATLVAGCAANGVGGRGFNLRMGSAVMAWTCGVGQSGYVIARFGSFSTLLPFGGALPGSATSFVDTLPSAGLSCYMLLPFSGSPPAAIANSDPLCMIPNVRSPTGAPTDFTIRFNESSTAHLSWGPPAGGHDGYALLVLGPEQTPPILLGGAVTATTHETGGQPRCYLLVAGTGGAPSGNTDVLCGIPGQAHFS
jgi:glucose/arabinose dehydrogenase